MGNAGGRPATRIGRYGVWSGEVRFAGPDAGVALAGELEQLGWSAVWVPGGIDDGVLADLDRLLSATRDIMLCTGILNLWKLTPEQVGTWWRGQTPERQARLLIGVGISHAPLIGDAYSRPIGTTRAYVEQLIEQGLPRDNLCLAALGPKMLGLSAELTAGAHPYLVTPEHTAIARKVLGQDALLAPEQGVILETDAERAREIGRQALSSYLGLPNYVSNWRRLGFDDADFAEPSDRLVDALFAWGDVDAIAARLQAHLDAGADHVCIQAVAGPMLGDTDRVREVWRAVAARLS